MTQRSGEPQKVSDVILENIIGKRPRKPQTYEMRKLLNAPEDIAFCKRYDDRLAEWEAKAEEVRLKTVEQRQNEVQEAVEHKPKENPPVKVLYKDVLQDFMNVYPRFNLEKNSFSLVNPYSENHKEEPKHFIHTLICYFLKHEKFFDSPMLNKELSIPSFNKGLLIIGRSGNGKTSTIQALIYCFNNFVKHISKTRPSNYYELVQNFKFNQCVTTDIVNEYNLAPDAFAIKELLNPLYSKYQLLIDDVLREQIANNFGKRNIFLDVLLHRADNGKKTHITVNLKEEIIKGKEVVYDTEASLSMFKEFYDGRVYDRLFGNYNIIELNGKSFRR